MSPHSRNLRSAWAKHHQAERRARELSAFVDDFFEDRSHRSRMRADFESGWYVLRVTSVPDLESFIDELGVLAGEIVHHLRSALDHLAWQLACECANGPPKNPRNVAFKVCESAASALHRSPPAFLSPGDWQRLHEFQPCKGRNGRPDGWSGEYIHQLSLLHDMWNQEKHKTLPIIMLTPNQFSMIPTRLTLPPWIVRTADSIEFLSERIRDPDPDAETYDFTHADLILRAGAEVGRMKVPAWRPRSSIEDVGEVIPRVALEDARPIHATIERLADFVQLILSSF
jgi:hypothetical protein